MMDALTVFLLVDGALMIGISIGAIWATEEAFRDWCRHHGEPYR